MPEALLRKPYQGEHRSTLEEEVTQPSEPNTTTSETDPELSVEEQNWKKRYGDLRTFNNQLTEKVKSLENQLHAAQKKEIQIPSSPEEINAFAQRYPDVFRHIRSIAMQEILSQKADLEQETNTVKQNLETLKRQEAERKILVAHPNFEDLKNSSEFHTWAERQSAAIQRMLFESDDPDDCIAALDLYKAHTRPKPGPKPRSNGADTLVRTPNRTELSDDGGERIWKMSEIQKLHPSQFEKLETEIEKARSEGRIDLNA